MDRSLISLTPKQTDDSDKYESEMLRNKRKVDDLGRYEDSPVVTVEFQYAVWSDVCGVPVTKKSGNISLSHLFNTSRYTVTSTYHANTLLRLSKASAF